MTLSELRKYDGKNEDGRICIAVNRKIFDVSKGGHSWKSKMINSKDEFQKTNEINFDRPVVNQRLFIRTGDKFYGPGKSYSPLAGKDATRALGTFEIDNVKGNSVLFVLILTTTESRGGNSADL